MTIDQKEVVEPKFEVELDAIYDDPYSLTNVFYHVVRFLKYPIKIVNKEAKPAYTRPGKIVPVLTDSAENKRKLQNLFLEFTDYNVAALVEAVELGEATAIKGLLKGDDADFYEYHPTIKFEREIPQEVLERCFMAAYDRLVASKGDSLPQRYLDRLKTIYEGLDREGVRPIDPEALGLIIIPIIEEIQAKYPALKP